MEVPTIFHSEMGAGVNQFDRKQRYYDTEDSRSHSGTSTVSGEDDEDDDDSANSDAALNHNMIPPGLLAQFDRSGLTRSERKTTIMSIRRLSSHVPECVRQRLEQEIELKMKGTPRESSTMTRVSKSESSDGEESVNSESSDELFLKAADFLDSGGNNVHNQQQREYASPDNNRSGPNDVGNQRNTIGSFVVKPTSKRNSMSSFDSGKHLHVSSLSPAPSSYSPFRRLSMPIPSVHGAETSQLSPMRSGRRRSDSYDRQNPTIKKDVSSRYFDETRRKLPFAEKYYSALLLVDISGFTKLATLLSPEQLSKAINTYFNLLVDIVVDNGGDVLKFAGDALFAAWPSSNQTELPARTCCAAICGARIVGRCSNYPIVDDENRRGQIATLNVHCAVGTGELVGVHVGNKKRREYLFLGDPIDQVVEALSNSGLGEVVASPQAMKLLKRASELPGSTAATRITDDLLEKQVVIARFSQPLIKFAKVPEQRNEKRRPSTLLQRMPVSTLTEYRNLVSLYAHSVVVANDAVNQEAVPSTTEYQSEVAELRTIFVMFIKIQVTAVIHNNGASDNRLLKRLNNIFNLVTRELDRFSGHLRQFIVDDKGVVLIATFGLRGSTCANMVPSRALPATVAIHKALLNELGVKNKIGATMGRAYCGVVGGLTRHEYAVLGPSVNLAARLMSSPRNPGILVDNAVRLLADQSYAFNALAPVRAKGYPEPVPIYEPLNALDERKLRTNFVGRRKEIMSLVGIAREMAAKKCPSRFAFIIGESGMWKGTMVSHALEYIQRYLNKDCISHVVTRASTKENDRLHPFGIFGPILQDVLGWNAEKNRDTTSVSSQDRRLSDPLQISDASTTTSISSGQYADRLNDLLQDIGASPEFKDLAHFLLGLGPPPDLWSKPGISFGSLTSQMARVIMTCVKSSELLVMAVDDSQEVDEMSWKVLRILFERAGNVVVICTARPLKAHSLNIEESFWNELMTRYRLDNRFFYMELKPLSRREMQSMVEKTLGLSAAQVNPQLVDNVLKQSRGMPHIANEILESIQRQYESGGNLETLFKSVKGNKNEIFVHRIDNCSAAARKILNICAVWGSSFYLEDLIDVLQRMESAADVQTLRIDAIQSLSCAVSEKILTVAYEGGDMGLEKLERRASMGQDGPSFQGIKYSFYHHVWRSTLLRLMLDERKRELHKSIALTLEARSSGEGADNLALKLRIFSHWKAGGESSKAAPLAIEIGKSFDKAGLQSQSIRLYQEALGIWENGDPSKPPVGVNAQLVSRVNDTDIGFIISLQVALGQSMLCNGKIMESVAEFQTALQIFQAAKVQERIIDRSAVFPIYCGIYSAIKLGKFEQDDDLGFERTLVFSFLSESRRNTDRIHYFRALAMEADVMGRLGDFDCALDKVDQILKIYDAGKHSTSICHAYGSDKVAQTISLCSLWKLDFGDEPGALKLCRFVIETILPKMDEKNVENSFELVYPVLWVLKESGRSRMARRLFQTFVVQPFEEYAGAGGISCDLLVQRSITMLLELSENEDVDDEKMAQYVRWASDEENLRFDNARKMKAANRGRCMEAVNAEICFLLAKRVNDTSTACKLVRNGLSISRQSTATKKVNTLAQAHKGRVCATLQELEGVFPSICFGNGSVSGGTNGSFELSPRN